MSVVSAASLLSSSAAAAVSSLVSKPDSLDYDLAHLAAFDPAPLDASKTNNKNTREQYLAQLSRDNCQLLMNRVFSLPSVPLPGEAGRVVRLPEPLTATPRAKPIPKQKEPTKWEKFAALKGITKTKRERMVFDEAKQAYAPRWGYGRASEGENVIIEHREGDDPTVDPWTRMKQEKRQRVEKNEKQRAVNLRQASGARLPGTIDLASAIPSADKKRHSDKKRAKQSTAPAAHHVDVALKVAQQSTASMGKFDQPRKNEKAVSFPESRSLAHANGDVRAEKARSLSVLNKLLGKSESDGERVNLDKAASLGQQRQEAANKRGGAASGGKGKGDKKRKRN